MVRLTSLTARRSFADCSARPNYSRLVTSRQDPVPDQLRDRLQSSLGDAYTLERELGGGGMARVFVATDPALGRQVVVKVLSPETAEGMSAERFTREIRLAAALQDPHIVPVLTAGQTAEYVDQKLAGEALQLVDDHLSGCEQCVVAVADLRTFRNEIAPSLDREYQPATLPPSPVKASWLTRFGSLFRVSPIPAFGGAALAVLLLAVVAWLVWRTPNEREPQIVPICGSSRLSFR